MFNEIVDLGPLRGMPLAELRFEHNLVRDLTPLKDLPLTKLRCSWNGVRDLSPLADLELTELGCGHNGIDDLAPVAGMPLRWLACGHDPIRSLAPLEGMPLEFLECSGTRVKDLSVLRGMPLRELGIVGLPIDVDLLEELPLEVLAFTPPRLRGDINVLRQHKTLRTLCSDGELFAYRLHLPVAEFWDEWDRKQNVDAAAIERIFQRTRQAWVEPNGDPDPSPMMWPEFVYIGTRHADGTLFMMDVDLEGVEAVMPEAEQIRALPNPPIIQVQGPGAMMRGKKIERRIGGRWETVELLEMLLRRGGEWRIVASIDGDWHFGPDDRFDPANPDHKAIAENFERGHRIVDEEDVDLFDEIFHPRYVMFYRDGPDDAGLVDREEIKTLVRERIANQTFEHTRSTILRIKINGPVAVLTEEARRVGDEASGGRISLIVLCRTADGWRSVISVLGNWSEVLTTSP